MNLFVEALNRIKIGLNVSWLSKSQSLAYDRISEGIETIGVVNLWGAHGVGKTFLGWVIHKEGLNLSGGTARGTYFPFLRCLERSETKVAVIDNLSPERKVIREAIHRCRWNGFRFVILITLLPAQDQIPSVRIELSEDDFKFISQNLERNIGGFFPWRVKNLWEMIKEVYE